MADATRKLATIVALDVAGYSARTEADEARTTAEVAALRKVIETIAGRHGGRVFNTAGDGFMLEFPSSLLAVEAAFELAETCEPKVRVGVHLGDVMVQPNGDLLGHGVNVAARLMAQAEPGKVLVSSDVKRMMRGPLAQSLHSRGTIKLPKMSETIEVFTFLPQAGPQRDLKARVAYLRALIAARVPKHIALIAGALAVAAVAVAGTLLLPRLSGGGPVAPLTSIAVLPFENLSAEQDTAFFAVGIQDEILTRLSKIGSLKVISRTSTAKLGSRPDNLRELGRQLGAANIVEGSVQREGNRVRVHVQLIKAETDEHLWADIFDGELNNIFAVQSEFAVKIAGALNATVTAEEKKTIALQVTDVPEAYDAYVRGVGAMHERGGRTKAAEFFRQAIALDPDFALAWAYMARIEAQTYSRRDATEGQRKIAREALDKALTRPDLPETRLAEGFYTYYVEKDYDRARKQFERVHATWPNEIETFQALGSIARRQGRLDQARANYEQAVARDPLRQDLRSSLISVLVATRNLDAALEETNAALANWPDDAAFTAEKARILQRQGKLAEAGALLKPLRTNTEGYVWRRIVSQALYERRYDDAIAVLERALAQTPDPLTEGNMRLDLGRLRALSGDAVRATQDLEKARALFAAEFLRQPKNAGVLNALAWAYCYLGDRTNALNYVQRAIGLAETNSRYEDTQMRIWSYFGDKDLALAALARLQKMPTGFYTPAMLRLDPIFDKLRGDPRFEAMAAEDAKVN